MAMPTGVLLFIVESSLKSLNRLIHGHRKVIGNELLRSQRNKVSSKLPSAEQGRSEHRENSARRRHCLRALTSLSSQSAGTLLF